MQSTLLDSARPSVCGASRTSTFHDSEASQLVITRSMSQPYRASRHRAYIIEQPGAGLSRNGAAEVSCAPDGRSLVASSSYMPRAACILLNRDKSEACLKKGKMLASALRQATEKNGTKYRYTSRQATCGLPGGVTPNRCDRLVHITCMLDAWSRSVIGAVHSAWWSVAPPATIRHQYKSSRRNRMTTYNHT